MTGPNQAPTAGPPDALAGVTRVLVVGFARSGQAVARVLRSRGIEVEALDDAPSAQAKAEAARLSVRLVSGPSHLELAAMLGSADLVVASPGVPPSHPAILAAPSERLASEIELAARLSPVPLIAITGTNGKTTVTSLVSAMLTASGRRAPAAGNIGRPLIEAVLEPGLDLVVAEVSSFQLAFTQRFRPAVGTYLNLAEDHLDWHGDLASYAQAKALLWARQGPSDLAVANAEDEIVMAAAARVRSHVVTFGLDHGDYHLAGEELRGPGGVLATRADLLRALPHDVANALAALATALGAGANPAGCRAALRTSVPLPHRVELVAASGGVGFYDDSKATTPSAVAAALGGFSSVVLIAGGKNKGLDLRAMRQAADAPESAAVRAVIAIGESAVDVARAFAGYEVAVASSMSEAVALARAAARDGDAVLLSPGCASFDWYRSYEERGEDFARCVRALIAKESR